MNILSMKRYFFPCVFASILMYNTGCICSTRRELNTKNEEMKNVKLDLHLKEKTIADLLDRLSVKDQEIGKLTDELHSARVTIEDLKSDIEKLREIDVQVEEKKKEVDASMAESIPGNIPEVTPETKPTAGGEGKNNE